MALSKTYYHSQTHKAVTRTIVQSSKVQWMLPAKLRDRCHEDIVIIREFGISLEELKYEHLIELEPKANFDARILAARVLDTNHKSSKDTVGQENNAEEPIHSKGCPPQILVLCLASGYLLFVTLQTSFDGALEFVYSRRPLPVRKSEKLRFGRHLALNSDSRVLACSSAYGHFGLFALKDAVAEYHSNVLGPRRLPQLVSEERFFKVDGHILKMDFIPSANDVSDDTHLLLLIAKGEETYVMIYKWNSRESLIHVLLDERFPAALPIDDRKPLHLIPMTRPMSFTLVFDRRIALYSIRLDGRWNRDNHTLPDNRSESPWVQWARPVRHQNRQDRNDDLYVCRQDGLISYVEVQKMPDLEMDVRLVVGSLKDCRIGTGLAIMSGTEIGGGPSGSDVILVAGDLTQGGVYVVEARKHPRCIQVLPNWTPVTDLLKVDPSIAGPRFDCSTAAAKNRLFVCGGRGFAFINNQLVECGTINELRYGFEAQIRYRKLQYGSSAVTGLWALSDEQHQRIIFLMSVPERTLAVMVHFPIRDDASNSPFNPVNFYNADDGTAYGMRADVETLVAGCTSSGLAVQVTPIGICVLNLHIESDILFHPLDSESSMVAAVMHRYNSKELLVTCIKSSKNFALLLSEVKVDGTIEHAERIVSLPMQPTALDARTVDGRLFVAVGNRKGEIAIFEVETGRGFIPLATYNLATVLHDLDLVAVHSLVILDASQRPKLEVLCGFRSGWFLYLVLDLGENDVRKSDPAFQVKAQQNIGHTSVQLVLDSTNQNVVFAMCESSTFIFQRLLNGTGTNMYRLCQVFLSDHLAEREGMAFQCQQDHHMIRTVARIPAFSGNIHMRDLEDSIVCVLDNELVFCKLSPSPKAVPRTMSLKGNPKHMVFSKRLGKIIAAVEVCTLQNEGFPDKTVFTAVDPNDSRAIQPIAGLTLTREYVHQMISWRPKIDGKEYETMVIVANDDERSRLILCKIIAGSEPELKIKYSRPYPKQRIHRIASYRSSAIIMCIDKMLVLQILELPAKRWRPVCELELPSPAVAITTSTNGEFIYVTTSRHSLHILTVENEQFVLLERSPGSLDAFNQTQIGSGVMISGTSRQGAGSLIGYAQPTIEKSVGGEMLSKGKRNLCKLFETEVDIPIQYLESCERMSGGDSVSGETYFGISTDGTVQEITISGELETSEN